MIVLPKSQELIKPLLRVLASGNLMSNEEIRLKVSQLLSLTEEQKTIIHSGTRTEFEYRLAWARTKAKSEELITSPKRESWMITEKGKAKV